MFSFLLDYLISVCAPGYCLAPLGVAPEWVVNAPTCLPCHLIEAEVSTGH